MAARIHIHLSDDRWRGRSRWVRTAAKQAFMHGEVAIQLASDAEVRVLNRQFRQKDKPTNVLSFPDGQGERLGDIILAYETIAYEAQEQKKSFKNHLMHLVVHGILHLRGYDHETPDEASTMEAKEIALLAAMGIANPYECE